ncbi:uncharacterized protein isoform X1 [Rhodnius prolixus]
MKRKPSMTEENFDKIMASAQTEEILKDEDNESKAESDKDSDYGGSDYDTGEATTFRMLIEKTQVSDREFMEACQTAGLIAHTRSCTTCSAAPAMALEDCPASLDGVEWKCLQCGNRLPIREGTWVEDVRQIRMKDIILILYCWSRNYPEHLCQHEMDLVEVSLVPFIYKKCQKLCSEYFNHEISNIGGPNTIVEIEEFQTPAGLHIVGGVEKHNLKNVFFRVLPENWTRDDLCTAIADNITSGTNIHCHNQTIVEILGTVGVRYLSRVWGLALDTSATCDSPLVASLWALFERLISDQDYTEHSLLQFLYRRRMEVFRDPFLATVHIISKIHPPQQ